MKLLQSELSFMGVMQVWLPLTMFLKTLEAFLRLAGCKMV